MFVGLLSVCTVKCFSRSLPSNYNKPIKHVTFFNQSTMSS